MDKAPETDLKPCPFCESTKVKIRSVKVLVFIYCSTCGACGPLDHEPSAVSLWNRAACHPRET